MNRLLFSMFLSLLIASAVGAQDFAISIPGDSVKVQVRMPGWHTQTFRTPADAKALTAARFID